MDDKKLDDHGEMLLGAARDAMLLAIKKVLLWTTLSEDQQIMINNAVEQAQRDVIRQVTGVAAARDFPAITVTVSKLSQKGDGALEAKLSVEDTVDNLVFLWGAHRCIVVKADPEVFMGAKPAPVMPDQPDILDSVDNVDPETGEIIPPAPKSSTPPSRYRNRRAPPQLPPPRGGDALGGEL